ncbi:MAG: DUF1232 domain-containing protein, partial [Muribaculaceae bacterium]|nr:DUF1232 domain-containing protein [Muribaculaceae bacterium]
RINDFKEKYNSSDLMKKIAAVAKKAVVSTVYHALLIYYALMSDKVPTSKKVIAIAALGYFIAPLDFIPDFVLLGLLDDGSVLLFAINQILPYITTDVKIKAFAKLNEWFGESDIVSIKSTLLPEAESQQSEALVEAVKAEKPVSLIAAEVIERSSNNMVIIAPYRELNDYIAKRFNQPITLAYGNDNEVKVTYTKRIVFNMSVNIRIMIEEVKADSILLSYDVAFGLDSIISGALSFIKATFPELSSGIHPEDGHRIRINLSEIEQARAMVNNIELKAILPCEDALRIEFRLK